MTNNELTPEQREQAKKDMGKHGTRLIMWLVLAVVCWYIYAHTR